MKDLKLKYNTTFATSHSKDFYRGRSFHYSGQWTIGVHYVCDDYNVDFVAYTGCLLVCKKSHLSSVENKPANLVIEDGSVVGINSDYWDFVLSGKDGKVYFPHYEAGKLIWELVDSGELPSLVEIDLKGLIDQEIETADIGSKIYQDIVVAGGPLADDLDYWPSEWKDESDNRKIPSGTSLEELLSTLFTKRIWYTPQVNYAWPTSITKAPTVRLSKTQGGSAVSSQTVEAGTIFYFGGGSSNTGNISYNVTTSGYSNGYKKNEDGDYLTGLYSKTYSSGSSGSYTLAPSVVGFKSDLAGTTASNVGSSVTNTDLPSVLTPMYVNDGSNYISVVQTGPTYNPISQDAFEEFRLYAASNVKTFSDAYSVQIAYPYTGKSTTASGTTNSATITGFRKYFYGFLDSINNNLDASVIRSLTNSTSAAASTEWTLNVPKGKAQVVIAVPYNQYTKLTVFQVSISDYIQNVQRAQWLEINVPGANNYKPIKYLVWTYSPASGSFPADDTYRIKFTN